MLDKFWAVPTVRSWFSRGWISFKVVAAVGTREGLQAVRNHRVAPEVLVQQVALRLSEHENRQAYHAWRTLIETYGPERVGGAGRKRNLSPTTSLGLRSRSRPTITPVRQRCADRRQSLLPRGSASSHGSTSRICLSAAHSISRNRTSPAPVA